MKRVFWLLALCSLSLNVFVGCGGPGEADPKGAVTPEQQKQMDDVGKVPGT